MRSFHHLPKTSEGWCDETGFCRIGLAKWALAAAKERGIDATYDDARTFVYGEPFGEWKAKHQSEASEEQQRKFEETKPLHAVIEGG